MNASTNVVVMMGGISSEFDISMKSGNGVLAALRKKGFDAHPFVVRDGLLTGFDPSGVDVVFIALHGMFGEDGGIQRHLERLGIPYTGSGPEASALAMDKLASKERFEEVGLRIAPHVHIADKEDCVRNENYLHKLGFPLIVKPVSEGSSIGLSLARHHAEFFEAIDVAAEYQQGILVEKFIPGRELTVAILGEDPLTVIEIIPDGAIFDYRAKYSGRSEYLVPAPMDEELAAHIRKVALKAHRALGCRDVSRVDFRMEDGSEEPVVLEVNTIPGMTSTSLLPMGAALFGISYEAICEELVLRALGHDRVDAEEPEMAFAFAEV